MLLCWTTLLLEELIIHRSTIGSFISLAFSDQTIMYFFPPTDHVMLQFFSCMSRRRLKNIHISRTYLVKRNNLNQRGNPSASMGFITLPASKN